MKTKILFTLAAALLAVTGCVSTVSGGKAPGVPFISDKMEGRYERPLDQVFEAAKEVVKFNGTLVNESILHGETNAVKTVEGRIRRERTESEDRLVPCAPLWSSKRAPRAAARTCHWRTRSRSKSP